MADDNLIQLLPNEVRGRYLDSCEGMTPSILKMSFGLLDPMAEEQRKPRTNAAQMAARVAGDAMQAWQDIHQAHWSSVADPTADKRTAFLRSAQFARKALQKISNDHDRTLDAINEKAEHLATIIGNACKPPSGYGDAMIDAEVRAMARAEPDPVKAFAIAKTHPRAFATLPADVGSHLLGEDTYKTLRREHLARVEPDALADNDDLAAALAQLTKAQGELSKQANALIDFDAADRMAKLGNWEPPSRMAA